MFHLSYLQVRDGDRAMIAQASDAYLANGGAIEQLEITHRAPEPTGNLRERNQAARRIVSHSRREHERREQGLAERARILAKAGKPTDEIRKAMGMGPVAFEQFVARHAIPLRKQKP